MSDQRWTNDSDPLNPDRGLYSALVGVAAGLELESTLRRIVTNAVYLADATYGALGVLNHEGRMTDFIHVGIPEDLEEKIGALPTGQGLLGELSEHPRPLRLSQLSEHRASIGFPENHPPMNSFLGVPVRVRGEVFGNLYLTDKRDGLEFTDSDEQSVIAFATAAAVAIENARLYELATLREKWQRAVSEISTAVLSGDDSGEVLELIAEKSRQLTGASAALIALPDAAGTLTIEIVNIGTVINEAEPSSSVHKLREWLGIPAPDDSILQRSYAMGGSIIEDHCSIWDRAAVDQPDTAVAAVSLPLRTIDKVLGVLLLVWPHGSLFAAGEVIDLIESFAGQAALTLVLADAQQGKEEIAVLEDRDRIGRDLHDLVIQRVFATGMLLDALTHDSSLPAEAHAKVDLAVGQLDETIREIRQTIFDLHGPSTELSLREKISQEVNSATITLGFQAKLTLTGPIDSTVSPKVGEHLLAVIRESLINCAKHAESTEVHIRVVVEPGQLVCQVSDNGKGFTPGARKSGVANLESRASDLGGEFTIGNRVDETPGTYLRWSSPLG